MTPRRRAFLIDIALAVTIFIFALLSLTSLPEFGGTRPIDPLGIVLIAGQTLSLAWRRRVPAAVLIIVAGAFAVDRGLNYPSSWAVFGLAVALYTVGAELSSRRSLIIGGTTIGAIIAWTIAGVLTVPLPPSIVVTVAGFMALPFVLGREARRREQRALEYEARAMRAEYDREREAIEAVRHEQARIARELHDVVAHEVTVMTIQAGAANRVLERSPEDARAAMCTVEEAGHRALTEMRRLLNLLREGSDGELGPQPGIGDLETLVNQLSDAGLEVRLVIDGEPRQLPVGIDVNAYRIIQESLTNIVKHGGPGAVADVVIQYGADVLVIDVCDDGRGAAEALSTDGSGQGLVGMRERVALLDGTLEARPRRGGGYRVRGTIPLEVR